jgi:hypothetical protein
MDRTEAALRLAEKCDPVVGKSAVDYMMQVLVPSVVVRLIMEDMGQDEQAAVETLKNGASLGMFLHGE